jgi:conjugative relaxase-like TrwC/TraI family protein
MLASPRSVSKAMLGHYYGKDNYYFSEQGKFEICGTGSQRFTANDATEDGVKSFVKDRKLVAKDLTFSAPKSFGIEWALGCPEAKAAIDKAWRDAIKDGVDYMEKSGLLTYKFKDSDGRTKVGEARNCVFAPVHHQINREGEPQLHTHVLLLNSGYDKKGVNRALDFRAIMTHRNAIGRVVDHAFAKNIMKSGIALRTKTIETSKGKEEHYFEAAHIDDKTIEAFSTRRKQVLEKALELRQSGYENMNDGELKQIAATSSRKAKKELDREKAQTTWNEVAKSFSYQPLLGLSPQAIPETSQQIQECYEQAKAELFDKQAGVTRLELIDMTQKIAVKGGYAVAFDDVCKCVNEDRDLLRAGSKKEKFVHETYVSKTFLNLENANMKAMLDGRETMMPTVPNATQSLEKYNARLEQNKGYKLDVEQQIASKQILETKDFISGVQGYAGTGKTTLLQAVNAVSSAHGREIYGIAPSAKAAQVLEHETGIKSSTTDLFIVKNKDKINPKLRGGLLIMDESSMTGSVKMNEVIKIASRNGMQVVLTGDRNQLSAVQAGNDFGRFQDAGMATVKLENIRRQYDASRPEDQQELLRIGNTIAKDKNIVEAIKRINALASEDKDTTASEKRVQVTECDTSRGRMRLAAKEYVADLSAGRQSIILTDTNTRREQYNKEVRYYLKHEGRLGAEHTFFVLNSQGKEVRKTFAQNDRIIFGKNDYKLGVRNNETAKIIDFAQDKKGNITGFVVEKNDGKSVVIDCKEYQHVTHGYALTVHKSQGITTNKAIVDLSSKSYNTYNKEYVALSRHKTQLSVYSDNLMKIARQGRRIEHKLSAGEVLERKRQAQEHSRQRKFKTAVKKQQEKKSQVKAGKIAKPKPKLARPKLKPPMAKANVPSMSELIAQAREKLAAEAARQRAEYQSRIAQARAIFEARERELMRVVREQQWQKQGQSHARKLTH